MKRGVLLSAAIAAVGMGISGSAFGAPLLYHYNFTNGSNVSAGDSLEAGTGTLTTSGTATLTAPGVSGGATDNSYSAGTATTNNNSLATGTTATDPTNLNNLNQITVTAWLNADFSTTTTSNVRIAEIGTPDGNPIYFAMNAFNASGTPGNRLQATLNVQNPGTVTNGTTGNISADQFTNSTTTGNRWVFVAFTYDGSGAGTASTLNFYSGDTSNSATLLDTGGYGTAPGAFNLSNQGINIGNRSTFGRGFPGSIDDVRIYNGVLSLSDIQAVQASALSSVPEPASLGLMALGGAALTTLRRRRNLA